MAKQFDLYVDGLSEVEFEREFGDDWASSFYADMPETPPPTDDEIADMARHYGLDAAPF